MITLITGRPGNGKTLYGLAWVQAKFAGRTVYFSGIKDLMLPWVELDNAENWMGVPDGAVIVIDECQRVYRPRMYGAKVPAWVEALETHRHRGLDLVLITQSSKLVDTNVRRLVGQHFHVVRVHGLEKAEVFEWNKCVDDPDEKTEREVAVLHKFGYPTGMYASYHSAEVHTHKRNVPMRHYIMLAMPVLVVALGYVFYDRMTRPLPSHNKPTVHASSASSGAVGGSSSRTHVQTTAQYIRARVPRVVDMPESAPIYDQVAKVQAIPVISACLSMADRCKCYTDQGTWLKDISLATCRAFVAHGAFDPYRAPEVEPVQAADRVPQSSQPGVEVKNPVEVKSQPVAASDAEPMRIAARPSIVPRSSPWRFQN